MNARPLSNKTKILAIDDEVGFTRLLQLAAPQYEIKAENSPLRAIEAVMEFRPDLILMDRYMPGMSGEELAMSIKAHPKFGNIPIAFVTASAPRDSDGHVHTQWNGCPVLVKPISIESIDQCVKEWVKAH